MLAWPNWKRQLTQTQFGKGSTPFASTNHDPQIAQMTQKNPRVAHNTEPQTKQRRQVFSLICEICDICGQLRMDELRWSRRKDAALPRRRSGFDSRTKLQFMCTRSQAG